MSDNPGIQKSQKKIEEKSKKNDLNENPKNRRVAMKSQKMPSRQISTEKDNPNSPDVIQDYGMYPDIPDNLLVDVDTTPSVSLLRSSAPTSNLSIQEIPTLRNENVASSPTPPTLSARHEPSQPEDQQPSQ
ncbi:unnamed protein product [Parnassius apollo]|uniref:(apollo) hypothetical protein n=1 Tax=Parnassius apollo TaxID=110799 RepID=A0A8S3Y824_PARAO|nr:unnamed protein product [Parnassius apollo]